MNDKILPDENQLTAQECLAMEEQAALRHRYTQKLKNAKGRQLEQEIGQYLALLEEKQKIFTFIKIAPENKSNLVAIAKKIERISNTYAGMLFGYIKNNLAQYNDKGKPDFLLLLNDGRSVWIECKTEHSTQSTHQKEFFKKLQEKGLIGEIVRSRVDVEQLLKLQGVKL